MKPQIGLNSYTRTKRKIVMKKLLALSLVIVAVTMFAGQTKQESHKEFVMDKVEKSDQEWETCLTPEEYQILREKGTELAFTGEYYKHKEKGTYVCAGCGNDLFSSDTKYDSGSGWPAFFDALDKTKVNTKSDISYGMVRTEITCAKCDSHLGHVFKDGTKPTGLRYCVNSVALDFSPKK